MRKKFTLVLLSFAAGAVITLTTSAISSAVSTVNTVKTYANSTIASVKFDADRVTVTLHNNDTGEDDTSVEIVTTNQSLLQTLRRHEASIVKLSNSVKLSRKDIKALTGNLPADMNVTPEEVQTIYDQYIK
jgi:predicted secreted protein